ncbi:transcriptional regulator [Pseudopedobacter saltans DSM 12145]|uniref:Transcriptional regulator n=1 Tax=Pseudopedobacter saltans (strain ATCC 51119 / DSM 12145 / JCM 21818 / CCUG 39354 / LMG 10337 / NBRC 100064 / NCIMB 13643) TaxID=762903 RepID=F0S6S8_PSESL|nr:DUF6377 domain-containing protein [Pseudopedobacter saltans]ADY52188.1 transcriptional regulator [Pseudopedobacter saltans DSM 12145]
MKGYLFLFLLLYAVPIFSKSQIDSLLEDLDNKVKKNSIYIDLKESKIEEIKSEKQKTRISRVELYSLNKELFKEYKCYISDSAVHYLNQNLDIAHALKDQYKINETSIAMSALFVRLGMYKEAFDFLASVKRSSFDGRQKLDYYLAYRELYLGLGSYARNNREKNNYWRNTKLYNDTLKTLTLSNSEEYLRIIERDFRENKEIENALKINGERLKLVKEYSPAYALITFHRSLIYRKAGDVLNEKKYLILSAISDVQLAIKDNASIPILANILMQEGDINRAYTYIRFSLENIKDYNTRLRSSEILNIQTIIDKEYQTRNDKKNSQLRAFLLAISVLSILLIVSVISVYKQMKKDRATSIKLKEVNEELNSLNQKLHDINEELKKKNHQVAEANHIKEEYIGYFLDVCSKYIDKLDNYRKMVYKKMQDRQYESLLKISKDISLKEEESKELFANFDKMFINLFPDFVEKFNSLLLDDEMIFLKKGEVLNTELRIYALMRLGISDSSKIASFLGYSVNTIYNYRTKMKNRAKVSRDDFEPRVKEIGDFS